MLGITVQSPQRGVEALVTALRAEPFLQVVGNQGLAHIDNYRIAVGDILSIILIASISIADSFDSLKIVSF